MKPERAARWSFFALATLLLLPPVLIDRSKGEAARQADAAAANPFKLATFTADVTPPLGHPLFIDMSPQAKAVDDPLRANGFVLWGTDKPVVLVSVDWMEIRNDAYDRWRTVLADA